VQEEPRHNRVSLPNSPDTVHSQLPSPIAWPCHRFPLTAEDDCPQTMSNHRRSPSGPGYHKADIPSPRTRSKYYHFLLRSEPGRNIRERSEKANLVQNGLLGLTCTRVPSKLNLAVRPFPSRASSRLQISAPVSQSMMQMCSSSPLLMNLLPSGEMEQQRTGPRCTGST